MIHLIVSREYPPAAYPPGGIGAYVANIARLLAERGETVHVIGQRWQGAPLTREEFCNGKLIVHRVADDDVPAGDGANRSALDLEGLKKSDFPAQWFSWRAALLMERLIDEDGIDVVEGQEWEAPLYYFLLRRSLGLGPQRCPPCIVHLHSPSEFTRHFNGHPTTPPQFVTMKRMEAFCIRAADALLCPSHYLARQASDHFAFAQDRVKVIPLPVGFTPLLERSEQVWTSGSICFVGRIEPRKGIIEWFEAAARVAAESPYVHFDFVGADIWDMQAALLQRLPHDRLARFRFHGSRRREDLSTFLARATAGVVPSRWENFPNVCIEAMSSGLPVIATRLGGMVELVDDGRTGWLTADTGVAGMVDGLAGALRRCLAASWRERAEMGAAAAQSIRSICDNDRVVDEHLGFRAAVLKWGATTSVERPPAKATSAPTRPAAGVVIRVDRLADASRLGESIRAQTLAPRRVVIVATEQSSASETLAALPHATVVASRTEHGAAAWNLGLAACAGDALDFVLFLDRSDELLPNCLEDVAAAMRERPDVGIVSFWVERSDGSGRHDIAPSPEALYQLIDNDVRSASAFRVEALSKAPFRSGLPRGYDVWDLANTVMSAGWSAVTFPATLARRDAVARPVRWPDSTALRAMRAELLRPFSASHDAATMELIDLFVPIPLASRPTQLPSSGARERIGYYVERVVFHPVESMRAVGRKVQSRIRRLRNGHDDRNASQ